MTTRGTNETTTTAATGPRGHKPDGADDLFNPGLDSLALRGYTGHEFLGPRR